MTACSVYQYFNASGALLYVGITNRGVRRSHEHARTKDWWPETTGCAIEHYETRDEALERESYLIATYKPPHNTQGINAEIDRPVHVKWSEDITQDRSLNHL